MICIGSVMGLHQSHHRRRVSSGADPDGGWQLDSQKKKPYLCHCCRFICRGCNGTRVVYVCGQVFEVA